MGLWAIVAMAQPPSVEALATAVTLAVPGTWWVKPLEYSRDGHADPFGPMPQATWSVRLEPVTEHVHWSQPTLMREDFATTEDAVAPVEAWLKPEQVGDLPIYLHHSKSWHRKVVVGATVWELFVPCASGEDLFLAMEVALDDLVQPTGLVGRCACGGHVTRSDDGGATWAPVDAPAGAVPEASQGK